MRCIFIPIIIALLLIGCTRSAKEATEALTRAEAVMEENPDTALNILTRLDTAGLKTDRDRALYALLYTQAQIKTIHDDTNDSLIRIAVDYYSNTDDLRHKMLAYIYHGFILTLNDSLTGGIKSFLIALDIAEEIDDPLYAAMACRELSVIFEKTFNPAEEVKYAQKAYSYIKQTGKMTHIDWNMSGLAIAYHNHNMDTLSIKLSFQLLDSLKKRPNTILEIDVLRNLVRSFISSERSAEAIPFLDQLISLSSSSQEDTAWLGLCYALKGEKDSANNILQRIDTISGISDWLKYELSQQVANDRLTLAALKNMHNNNEERLEKRLSQSATLSMLEHHEQEKEIAKERAKTARMTTWLIIICGICLLMISFAIIIIIRRRQIKEHKRNEIIATKLQQTIQFHELEKRLAQNKTNKIQQSLDNSIIKCEIAKKEANELSEYIEQKNAEIDKLNQEITQINDEFALQRQAIAQQTAMYYSMIDQACTILWENPTKEGASGKITGWLDRFIEDLGSSPKKIKLLESYADRFYGNVMSDLRSTFPGMKEDDYKLFLFNLLGLSSAAIAKLLNADQIEPIYTRKKRLRGKINQLKDENTRHKFMQHLQRNKNILDFLS